MSFAPILPSSLGWLALQLTLPKGSMRWRGVDPTFLREMIGYSLNTLAYTAGTVVLFQSVKLIASWRCGGAAAAGHVGLAINVVHVVSVLFLPLAGVLHTRLSDLHMRGQWVEGQRLVQQSVAGIALLAVPSTIFLVMEARVLLHAWLGSTLDSATLDVIATTTRRMLVGEGFYVLSLPFFYALVGVGAASRLRRRCARCWRRERGARLVGGRQRTVDRDARHRVRRRPGRAGAARHASNGAPALQARCVRGRPRCLPDPVAGALPGVAALLVRPSVDVPLADLILAGLCFGIPVLPGLWWARRRLGAS